MGGWDINNGIAHPEIREMHGIQCMVLRNFLKITSCTCGIDRGVELYKSIE